jgi:hypothetical protein
MSWSVAQRRKLGYLDMSVVTSRFIDLDSSTFIGCRPVATWMCLYKRNSRGKSRLFQKKKVPAVLIKALSAHCAFDVSLCY